MSLHRSQAAHRADAAGCGHAEGVELCVLQLSAGSCALPQVIRGLRSLLPTASARTTSTKLVLSFGRHITDRGVSVRQFLFRLGVCRQQIVSSAPSALTSRFRGGVACRRGEGHHPWRHVHLNALGEDSIAMVVSLPTVMRYTIDVISCAPCLARSTTAKITFLLDPAPGKGLRHRGYRGASTPARTYATPSRNGTNDPFCADTPDQSWRSSRLTFGMPLECTQAGWYVTVGFGAALAMLFISAPRFKMPDKSVLFIVGPVVLDNIRLKACPMCEFPGVCPMGEFPGVVITPGVTYIWSLSEMWADRS